MLEEFQEIYGRLSYHELKAFHENFRDFYGKDVIGELDYFDDTFISILDTTLAQLGE